MDLQELIDEITFIAVHGHDAWCHRFLTLSFVYKKQLYDLAMTTTLVDRKKNESLDFIYTTLCRWHRDLIAGMLLTPTPQDITFGSFDFLLDEKKMERITQFAGKFAAVLDTVHQSNLLPAVIDFLDKIAALNQKEDERG